jgi:hypothetical protein
VIGCTTVTASYAAYAEVLAAGWLRSHTGVPFSVLLLDGDKSVLTGKGFRVLAAEELDISPEDLQVRRAIYDPFELANSLKSNLFRTLLAESHDAVVFLDSDTAVYENLADVGAAAAEHGVALSPHLVHPPPADGRYPGELDVLKYGVFNSGFVAAGDGAGEFLEWWSGRVRRDCVDDLASGMHVDQYWLQSVPAYFEHTVLRDPTLHVAHWNVHERTVEHADGRYLVDGRPLRTFHFSGLDPEHPDRLHRYPVRVPYRVDPAQSPALAQLLREYAAELLAAGYREKRALGYAYATSASGLRLGRWERAVYREAALASEAGAPFDLPNPFDPDDSAAFEELISHSGANLPLSPQAVKRLRAAKKIYAEEAGTPDAPGGLGTRARGFVRHRILGSEQGHRLSSDRTALEYRAGPA